MYCHGNPITNTDPTGHYPTLIYYAGGGGGGDDITFVDNTPGGYYTPGYQPNLPGPIRQDPMPMASSPATYSPQGNASAGAAPSSGSALSSCAGAVSNAFFGTNPILNFCKQGYYYDAAIAKQCGDFFWNRGKSCQNFVAQVACVAATGVFDSVNTILNGIGDAIPESNAGLTGYLALGVAGRVFGSLISGVQATIGTAGLESEVGVGIGGEGEFSIINWEDYPGVNRPGGPFRILEGEEYNEARDVANTTNRAMHNADPSLKGFQIHEIQPVKFGGSPCNSSNKMILTPSEHAQYTVWWNKFLRGLGN